MAYGCTSKLGDYIDFYNRSHQGSQENDQLIHQYRNVPYYIARFYQYYNMPINDIFLEIIVTTPA